MAHDPLSTLIKLRKLACDEAQLKLVDALTLEDRAEQAVHRVERTIAQETEAATDVNGSDAMVEAFGAWLPEARRQLAAVRQGLLDRQAETVRKRVELTACRTALETVKTLQQERREAAQRAVDRVYERELEEHCRTARQPGNDAPDQH